jgi:ATP-binding cassette subfamily C (CFTR/MRP) protein 1
MSKKKSHANTVSDVLFSASLSFHSSVDSGTTVNRFSEDLRLIDMDLPTASFGLVTSTFL